MSTIARHRRLVAPLLLLSLQAAETGRPLEAQQLGPELEIANQPSASRFDSAVAADRTGRFVVVWAASDSGEEPDIIMRRYDPQDVPLGSDFVVNQATAGRQYLPKVDADGTGRFVVVWKDVNSGGKARQFDASGVPVGGEFVLNSPSGIFFSRPIAVSASAGGGFACLWEASGCGFSQCTMARRFAADGTPIEVDFPVSLSNLFIVNFSDDLAMTAEGEFVVSDSEYGSYAGEYAVGDALLTRYTAESQEASYAYVDSPLNQLYSYPPTRIASNESGSFAVAWRSFQFPGQVQNGGIEVQLFDRELNPLSEPIAASTDTANGHARPDLAVDRRGNFVVVWESQGQDGSGAGIFAQRFAADGSRIGSEFQVNSYTTGDQSGPQVAAGNAGDFIVTWSSFGHGGAGQTLSARRIRSSIFWGGFELGDACGWSSVAGWSCN